MAADDIVVGSLGVVGTLVVVAAAEDEGDAGNADDANEAVAVGIVIDVVVVVG